MAPAFFPLPLLTLVFVLVLASSVRAGVNVQPSNNTQDLAWTNSVQFRFAGDSGPLAGHTLVPLTPFLVDLTENQLKSYKIVGTLDGVNPQNSLSLIFSQIACISCDPSAYPGPVGVDDTVNNVITAQQTAEALLLYSTSANHCNLTANEQTTARYPEIFTLVDSATVSALQQVLQTTGSNDSVTIISAMSLSGNSGANTPGPNSPNTAMIILYSVTGLITALFLSIIITGAVRAHRHPERYGTGQGGGRQRQSRARGIALAMLDTIPIVKFGVTNHDGVDAAKRDVEMAMASEDSAAAAETTGAAETTPPETELAPRDQHTVPSIPDAGNLQCPICTDDFIKGQDLRVLPCNHQFHPECVDPWLVNVSGTCPLCRIDLNPSQTEENADQQVEPDERAEAPDGVTTPAYLAQSRLSHRRLSIYLHGPLNARLMRNATVEERLAALRRIREASQGMAPEGPSRSRFTARLRDRFRIRTRTHGVDCDGQGATVTPTAPGPAHTRPTTSDA